MKLSRMQIHDPDNGVSDPTDLDLKPDSNRLNTIPGFVSEQWRAATEETALPHKTKVFRCTHCTVDEKTIDLRIAISTGRDLDMRFGS